MFRRISHLFASFAFLSLLPLLAQSANHTPDQEEWAFLTLINAYRAQNGAGALQISVALENSSYWMSSDMASHNNASHTDSLGRDARTRLTAFGYPYYPWGENIAGGTSSAQSVFNSWFYACDPDTSGACTYAHRQNMLNPSFVVIGIGRVYNSASTYGWYWTTDFGGYADATISSSSGSGPTISSFSASPSSISSGGATTLSWSVAGAGAISIDNGVGDVSSLTSKSVSPTQTTTYTLTAANTSGISTASTTVTVTVSSGGGGSSTPGAAPIQTPASLAVGAGQSMQ